MRFLASLENSLCGENLEHLSTAKCIALQTIPDILIALAYFSIPVQLLVFVKRYPLPLRPTYKAVICLFASFIMLCGLTHICQLWKKYSAGMYLLAVVKVVCALVSSVTSVVLLRVIPGFFEVLIRSKELENQLIDRMSDLRAAKTRAEDADRAKSNFMSFLCHELRNPLHVVTSNVEFLLGTTLDQEQHEFASAIDTMSRLMYNITNDVLGECFCCCVFWGEAST